MNLGIGFRAFLHITCLLSAIIFTAGVSAQSLTAFDSSLQKAQAEKIDSVRVRRLLEIGDKFPDISPRQGLRLDTLLLAAAKAAKADSIIMQAHISAGRDFTDLSDFTSALKNYVSALEIAGRLNNFGKQALAYDQISWIYKTIGEIDNSPGDLDKAIEYLEKGLAITRAHKLPRMELQILEDLAIEYDIKKMHAKAIEAFQESIAKAIEFKDAPMLSTLYMNIGISYKNNKEFDKALDAYKKAMHIVDSLGSGFRKMYILDNMAILYYEMGQLQLSETTSLDAVQRSFENSSQPIRVDAYGLLKKLYEKEGKYKEAFAYSEKLTALKDSVLNKDKSAQLKDMQEKYETDIKNKLINAQQAQIASDKELNIVLAISGVALLLIAGFIYYNLQKTARLNKIVSKQRDELGKQSDRLSVMMKELHHRVKNNLQIVSSLLNLQSLKLNDDKAINAVQESKQRVQAMSLIHQRLYKTDDITRINMKEYITELADFLAVSYGYTPDNFALSIDVEEEWTDIDKALPLGLILNEVVTNAFKYAFAGIERPSLYISFKHGGDNLTLVVKDNGTGIDAARWNAKQSPSFGSQLVKALCSQLRAKETLQNSNGTSFTFIIPAA